MRKGSWNQQAYKMEDFISPKHNHWHNTFLPHYIKNYFYLIPSWMDPYCIKKLKVKNPLALKNYFSPM